MNMKILLSIYHFNNPNILDKTKNYFLLKSNDEYFAYVKKENNVSRVRPRDIQPKSFGISYRTLSEYIKYLNDNPDLNLENCIYIKESAFLGVLRIKNEDYINYFLDSVDNSRLSVGFSEMNRICSYYSIELLDRIINTIKINVTDTNIMYFAFINRRYDIVLYLLDNYDTVYHINDIYTIVQDLSIEYFDLLVNNGRLIVDNVDIYSMVVRSNNYMSDERMIELFKQLQLRNYKITEMKIHHLCEIDRYDLVLFILFNMSYNVTEQDIDHIKKIRLFLLREYGKTYDFYDYDNLDKNSYLYFDVTDILNGMKIPIEKLDIILNFKL